jgi:hypothetical protein
MHVAAKPEERKKLINGHPSEKLCVQCHNSITSPKFDFETFKKQGVHQVAAAEPAK